MGRLILGRDVRLEIDDRTLAHLQLVIGSKVRRGESLHLSWRDDLSTGGGRTVVWIHPRLALTYRFDGPTPAINREWIDLLTAAANSPSGLYLIPEPGTGTGTEP